MKKNFGLMLIAASLGFAVSSAAQAREFGDIYTDCGLGAMIAPTNAAVAAVTNVTWDLGSTAVSSNVSSAETCQGGKKKVASLIHNAYPQVTADIAKGQGTHLDALASAAQCGDAVRSDFKMQVRANFGQIAGASVNKSQQEKNEALYGIVKSTATQFGCSI